MKKRTRILIFVFCLLALSSFVKASISDSVLLKYSLHKNGQTAIEWNSSSEFYLANPITSAFKSIIQCRLLIRRLDSKWVIIKYDPLIPASDLGKNFKAVVPANNNWKFSELLPPLLQQYSGGDQIIRIGYLNESFKSDSIFLQGKAIIKKLYTDYNAADIIFSDTASLQQLASNKYIISIGPVNAKAHTEQAVKRFDKGANFINNIPNNFPRITGAGTTVSIKEDVFDTTDIDFKNRFFLTPFTSGFEDNHATIIASMVGSSGNLYYPSKGVAWQTRLTSANFSNLMPEPLSYYEQNKIDVQNHSYGTGVENEYGADAAAYDLSTWQDSCLLHIFSAGNSGTATSTSGKYKGLQGVANLTGSFKMSKNSLSIGGTDSFYETETLSSKGPAYDGRIKPDLVAYGVDGTSGAAAIVSGTALLLQQQLREQNGARASAALIKGLLINGCDNINGKGPDFNSGYGSLNASRSLLIASLSHYFTNSIKDGESHAHVINIPVNTAWLKITLTYTDTPAAPLAESAIVNDLDLYVEDVKSGSVFKPWTLSTLPDKASLQLPATHGADHLNTVEQVFILQPAAGDYRIVVTANNVVTNSQSFAITWHAESADSVIITSPSKSSLITANSKQIIRWQSSFVKNINSKLEYKFAGANNWQLIKNALKLQDLWHEWQTPDTIANAILRISNASGIFISDTFAISQPLALQVGYNCADSVYLFWNKLPVDNYRVYMLGDTLMKPISITSDTFYKAPANTLTSNFVAVASLLENTEAERSYAIDFTKQGVGCYVYNFTAYLFGDSVELQLTLGTTFNIAKIIVQKQFKGVFQNIDSGNALQLINTYTDKKLLQGGNIYRIRLVLSNGTIIYSQSETIYFLGKRIYLLYPNPAKRQGNIYVVNRYYDGDLYAGIYDITGRLIKRVNVNSAINKIAINELTAGIYMVVFDDGNKKLGVEKLIVQ